MSIMVNKFRIFIKKLEEYIWASFLLTLKYLKQLAMKELRAKY